MDQTKKNEQSSISAMRAGFTLVELLVVVAIIGILGTIAIQNVKAYIDKTNETAARATVQNVADAVTAYYIGKKKMPTSLNQLIEGTDDDPPVLEGGDGALLDPWDNELKYEIKGKRFVVISAGPDGEMGTDDDIRSDKKGTAKSAN
ncbi:MAG: type II secretion system protein GspG [Kiritimatiellae bacterium]|nr:type II secretion system protein GspG [Kiritimatiellia bacterium]